MIDKASFRRIWPLAALLLLALGWQLAAGSGVTPCNGGSAGPYPCAKIDMLAEMSLSALGAEDATITGSDHWGWTDPVDGRRYVIFGLSNGVSFVDVTEPAQPLYLGKLPGRDGSSVWRDIKVYGNYAFIIADQPTNHGMQVFDLTRLRNVATPPVLFDEDAHYDGFGPAHNLWINAASGFAYAVRSDTCDGALHMVDVNDPLQPAFAGCYTEDGLASDAECINYDGPDPDYQGAELCFIGSDETMVIADVSDKSNPQTLTSLTYAGIARAHQGALTADRRYWLLSDTMDEVTSGHNTRTHVWDVGDLDAPQYVGYHEHATPARDHNLYIVGDLVYQTNWRAGLRVLEMTSLAQAQLTEIGYFDVAPASDSPDKSGAWSNYPWQTNGTVTVSSTDRGLFILQAELSPTDVQVSDFSAAPSISWTALTAAVLVLLVAACATLVWRREP